MPALAFSALTLATLLGVAGLQVHYWPTFVPAIPPAFLWRISRVVWVVRLVVLSLAAIGVTSAPTTATFVWGAGCLVLAMLTGFFHPRRAIPPVSDPPHERADAETTLAAEAPIVTVEVDGQHAAWPLELIVPHHVVHDLVGARPVVATWCQSCRTAVVFDRLVDGRPLTFEPAGVWRRNMLLRDAETGSIWQQASGECVAGPLAGRGLGVLGGVLERFGPWQRENPAAAIAREPPRWTGLLPRRVVSFMLEHATRHALAPGRTAHDDRLPRAELVVGLVHRGVAYAWPFSTLVSAGTLTHALADGALVLEHDPLRDRVTAGWTSQGQRLPLRVERLFWAGWHEFHPETQLPKPPQFGGSDA